MPNTCADGYTSGRMARGTRRMLEQLLVPVALVDVEQHGARGVRRVGDVGAALGQLPGQPGVDGAEGELAALGARARARDVVEQPGDLGAGEIRVEHQAGPLAGSSARRPAARSSLHIAAVRRSCQTMALAIGVPVCRSHSTVVSRWLVMPAATISLACTPAFSSASRATSHWLAKISFGSCSTQPGCGIDLAELLLRRLHRHAFLVEHDGARAGGALVEREDVTHRAILLSRLRRQLAVSSGERREVPQRFAGIEALAEFFGQDRGGALRNRRG